ncbi:Crinkler (CRN) family protein [Thraustotheca clavata]|uniref:Crinkler (CRN) family protein n=1 Tax=Thraustotheca clavata TaxID=74557 RepID=A0A1V9YMA3_9STRA|nr:Crinkler (CRN) family protein [Thraustotheca clavata]
MELCCVLVSNGTRFVVMMDTLNQRVSDLKKKIKDEIPQSITCDAPNLNLYLALKYKEWLTIQDYSLEQFQLLMNKPNLMEPFFKLTYYFNKNGEYPEYDDAKIHVLVQNPIQPHANIGHLSLLPNGLKCAMECFDLNTWESGKVHNLPCIYAFMKSFGGCTSNGKIFWRTEESQIVNILYSAWFKKSTKDNLNVLADKKAFLIGSPGVGKSTLLCLVAFYVVYVYKKKILMYRRVAKLEAEKCLVYLALDDNQEFIYQTIPICTDSTAINIYKTLWNQFGIKNVWLFLDGFIYNTIPDGLLTFNLLATPQLVDLKSKVAIHSFRCLFPCWSKKDLISLGQQIYKYELEEIEDRYYYSGGSVREFTLDTVQLIKSEIDTVVLQVKNVQDLVDCLHHTFVQDATMMDHFLNVLYWVQIIDTEYAVASLSVRLRSDDLHRIYIWALDAQLQHLAGCAFKSYLHRAMGNNSLVLHISEYDSRENGHISWVHCPFKIGLAQCKGSANEDDYRVYLKTWSVDTQYRYWFPYCHNFPTIDSIVKLKSTADKKEGIAYLQTTVSNTHDINAKQLEIFNKIFYSQAIKDEGNTERPIYIVICPNRKACESIVPTKAADVVASRKVCQLYVGYFDAFRFGGPSNNIPIELPPPNAPYNFRPRRSTAKRPREA